MNVSTVIDVENEKPLATPAKADMFELAGAMAFGDIHIKFNSAVSLRAIVAVHNTKLGPALGGCRLTRYPSTEAALTDAMRLARAMSYKAAVMGLPLGGGKAVLLAPPVLRDRRDYFLAFADFINELGGRYITAVDIGTGVADMDIIAERSQYVRGMSEARGGNGDPSPSTAFGVCRGMEAAVRHKLKRATLEDVHVVVQGLGHVGFELVRLLHARGAKISVHDLDDAVVQRCVDEFGCARVPADQVYHISCDVFAPCATGAVINDATVDSFCCAVIAGAANNQLAHRRHARALHRRGILYAPDYVINGGGLVHVAAKERRAAQEKVNSIHDILTQIFQRAEKQNVSPAILSDQWAEEILYGQAMTA